MNPTRRQFAPEVLERLKAQAFDIDTVAHPPIVVVPLDYPAGWHINRHKHDVCQLVYCSKGMLTVKTDRGIWVAPPYRAVWLPAHEYHSIFIDRATSMRTVYVNADLKPDLPKKPCAVTVSPVLRELILRACEFPICYEPSDYMSRLMGLILDEIVLLPENPLSLQYPTSEKIVRICEELSRNPADRRTAKQWAAELNTTDRTIERLFLQETAMSFKAWRIQIKLLKSLVLLGANKPVKTVAYELGFKSEGPFIRMFKKTFGVTPGEYCKTR